VDVSDQLHASAALPLGKEQRYLLNWRLSKLQSRSGPCGGDKNCTLPGIETGPSSYGLSLYQLPYEERCKATCKEAEERKEKIYEIKIK
jgi:hypothetical protein